MRTGKTTESVGALFEPLVLRNTTLKNRLIRSATYEGLGDSNGAPRVELADLYKELANGGVGTIITGFVFVSQAGRAMQPQQCGIDMDDKIPDWSNIVGRVRRDHTDIRLFMQIAHTGRQTRRELTGLPVMGVSSRRCAYFKQKVHVLDDAGIESVIQEFGNAARRAQRAGFDGVQVHAAHGYLIHQFLSPWINTRADKWSDGPRFLEAVIRRIRSQCGSEFPVLVKLSWADDNRPGVNLESTIHTVKRLEPLGVDGVEISYGSMEFALNIIRGACPVSVILNVNPLFNRIPGIFRKLWKRIYLPGYLNRLQPFSENYNLSAALKVSAETRLPVMVVGGIRSADSMMDCLKKGISAVSLCRPLICEPDLPRAIKRGESSKSRCTNCNLCAVYCDSANALKCYQNREERINEKT